MKLITIIFTLLIMTACKTVTLKNEALRRTAVTPHGFCLRLSPKAQEQQYIHGIYPTVDQPEKDKIIFFYYLQEYVTTQQKCNRYRAIINNDRMGINHHSAFTGKGSSFNSIHTEMSISIYDQNSKLAEKKYYAESVTSIVSLFDSEGKRRKYIVEAMQIAINDIVKQISDDINRLKKQTK